MCDPNPTFTTLMGFQTNGSPDPIFCLFSRVPQNTPRASVSASRGLRRIHERDMDDRGKAVQRKKCTGTVVLECDDPGGVGLEPGTCGMQARCLSHHATRAMLLYIIRRLGLPHWHSQRRSRLDPEMAAGRCWRRNFNLVTPEINFNE